MITPSARLSGWTGLVLLALMLTISPILGLVTPYVAGLIGIGIWVATALGGQLPAAYASYPARAFLAVFALLALLFALSAETPGDVLLAFNFTMLPLYGPIALLLSRSAAPDNAARVATLATIGVGAGFAMLVVRAMATTPWERAYGFNIGPIVLSNALIALGFIALGGVLTAPPRRALLFAVAAPLAIAATFLTGSRGPLLAVPFLVLFSLVFLGATRFRGSRLFAIGTVVVLAAGAGGALLLAGTRSASLLDVAGQLLSGTGVSDRTTRIRFILYEAGWQAFLQQPWIGHGWADIMEAIKPFLAPEDLVHAKLPQLHNDVLNFAVAGGVAGVAGYLGIISAPLIGALTSPRDSLRPFRIYAMSVLTITYVFAGLTDLMFGFEFHTALFVMLTAIVLGYCRDAPAESAG